MFPGTFEHGQSNDITFIQLLRAQLSQIGHSSGQALTQWPPPEIQELTATHFSGHESIALFIYFLMVKLPSFYLSYFQQASAFFPLASLIALPSTFNHHTGHRKSFSRLAGICTPVCPYTLHYTVKISGPNSGRNLTCQFNEAWPDVGACCLVCI